LRRNVHIQLVTASDNPTSTLLQNGRNEFGHRTQQLTFSCVATFEDVHRTPTTPFLSRSIQKPASDNTEPRKRHSRVTYLHLIEAV